MSVPWLGGRTVQSLGFYAYRKCEKSQALLSVINDDKGIHHEWSPPRRGVRLRSRRLD
ncbi:hypothetical protein SERLA73DRAFT_141535 [Serpula lacrymans var. lacrymans S7.3]|uniref:Uncharacterized protein n=1 Tax=Serpula lacrymans var. lacrymans (strain S7.3) TaxID=936435 RepID=F8Q6K1_SERL3|nr:hypothetical protein SERLA73DRAFT_141535 [Serpula lacrymans var. lacrymans S7.3]